MNDEYFITTHVELEVVFAVSIVSHVDLKPEGILVGGTISIEKTDQFGLSARRILGLDVDTHAAIKAA